MKSVENNRKLFLCCDQPDNLFVVCFKDWLIRSERFNSVNIIVYENIELMPIEDEGKQILWAFITSNYSNTNMLNYIKYINTLSANFYALVVDLIRMGTKEVKQILTLKRTGVISASIPSLHFYKYIDQIFIQDRVMSPDIQEMLLEELFSFSNEGNVSNFNKKEQAILDAATKGLSIKDTAVELNLSTNTIAVYRSKMIRKSGVSTFAQLVSTNLGKM